MSPSWPTMSPAKCLHAVHLTVLMLTLVGLLSACVNGDATKFSTPSPPQSAAPSNEVRLAIDGATQYQTFLGFGAALEPWELTGSYHRDNPTLPAVLTGSDQDKAAIAHLLFTDLGIH